MLKRRHFAAAAASSLAIGLFSAVALPSQASGASPGAGTIITVAGTGVSGFNGDDVPATQAQLNYPVHVATDRVGNLYISDFIDSRVRKVDHTGIIITVAGTGTDGFSGDGGPATLAQLSWPYAMATDDAGNLYIADAGNRRVRMVDRAGIISTVAGTGANGAGGDGGPATSAQLSEPVGLATDQGGNLYIADLWNQRVRKVDKRGIITTVVGTGVRGFGGDGGPATFAQLNYPAGLATNAEGNLFVTDGGNHRVREVDRSGTIRTVAGTSGGFWGGFSGDEGPANSAELNNPRGVATDSAGNLYIADSGNNRIRKVDRIGIITTVAGTGIYGGFGGDGGPATSAQLKDPTGVAAGGGGVLYIAEPGSYRIRKVIPRLSQG